MRNNTAACLLQALSQFRIGDNGDCAAYPRYIERLVRRDQGDRPRRDLWIDTGDRDMASPVVDKVGVDLIGADEQVVTQASLPQFLEFLEAEDAPHRVVWVAQDERRTSLACHTLYIIIVDLVAAIFSSYQFAWSRFESSMLRSVKDRKVNRRLKQQTTTGLSVGLDR